MDADRRGFTMFVAFICVYPRSSAAPSQSLQVAGGVQWYIDVGPKVSSVVRGGESAMFRAISRREVLRAGVTAGAGIGLGDLGFLSRLDPVSAAEAKLQPDVVRLQPEIEPLVRL